jgi:hypothetical protein
MHLAQDNDVVHALTPDRSYQPFGKAILPGRGWCGGLVPNAHGAQPACDDRTIDPVSVADHVARSFIPRERFGDLARNPFRGCGVTLIQTSSLRSSRTMMQAYSRSKPRFGTTNRSMAAMSGARLCKKVRHPWLGGPRRLTMYLATPEMRDLKPELEQFAVNAWRAPKRIFDAHPPNQ